MEDESLIIEDGSLDDENPVDSYSENAEIRAEDPENSENIENSETSENQANVGIIGCAAMVVNAALGAGMLNFPFAFLKAGGIINSIGLQLVVICLAFYGMRVLAKSVDRLQARLPGTSIKTSSYEGVMELEGGLFLGNLTKACVALYSFGTCVAFVIIIGDMVASVFGASHRTLGILVVSPLLLALSVPKNISFLKHASVLGVFSVVAVSGAILYETSQSEFTAEQHGQEELLFSTSKLSFLQAFPSICFAYQCHISAVPIYATSLKSRSIPRWNSVVSLAFLAILAVNSITGAAGYLKFQGTTLPDILSNFNESSVIDTARVFMTISIISSYGVLTFCGKTAVLNVIRSGNEENSDDGRFQQGIYYCLTGIWVAGSICLGIYVPDISNVIGVIGNLAAAFIFIFPGLVSIKTRVETDFRLKKLVLPVAMVVFGVFLMGVCLTMNFQEF